jgi:hypothetical protein
LLVLAVRSTGLRLAWMLPLPFLFFSLVQVGNILWAFQFAWMLILLSVAVSLWGLELGRVRHLPLLIAILAAAIASFSSLQGLLAWPAGLCFGIGRGLPRSRLVLWCAAGLISGTVYAWHFGKVSGGTTPSFAIFHPAQAAHYFLRLLGGVVPIHQQDFALLVLVASCLLGWLLYRRRTAWARARLGIALWLSGVLFDLLVTIGRVQLGDPGGSRYTTYNLLVLIGLYLTAVVLVAPQAEGPGQWYGGWASFWPGVLGLGVATLLMFQIAISLPAGLQAGSARRSAMLQDALVLREYRTTRNSVLASHLFPPSGAYVRLWAGWLDSQRWSVFSPIPTKDPPA